MDVVIVESPAKARTIRDYLGGKVEVLASYGHVRDLPPRDGSVDPENDFVMSWETDTRARPHLDAIVKALRNADKLILATDPDREGEAIAWHVVETLKDKGVLDDVDISRVSFNAITRPAVLDAMAHPRAIDRALVDAYLARRALDYLVGFTLSPILWRKLPGARSAGRVQSVALRLVCERELEREAFVSRAYWSVAATLSAEEKAFKGVLKELDGAKLTKFSLDSAETAEKARALVESSEWRVANVESKTTERRPAPPFMTSTLQQEAAHKLGFVAVRTMRAAQKLYEGTDINGEQVGLITYMRTDGVQITPEAIHATREVIEKNFGKDFVPEKPYAYKTKAKNAQEAHEAIRPTDSARTPERLRGQLTGDEEKLYALIWKRATASQMAPAQIAQRRIDCTDTTGKHRLQANGSRVLFEGFLTLYQEERDEASEAPADDDKQSLPEVKEGDTLTLTDAASTHHETQPPPRFGEASLVRRMEALGIGRPSTYAPILSILRERDYVKMEKNRFVPDDRGRLVVGFLEQFFARYVAYDFTAQMEQDLDSVSAGETQWKTMLRDFWMHFHDASGAIADVRTTKILDTLNESLGSWVFPPKEDESDPRACTACEKGQLSIKTGRFGAFVGCSDYPECRFTRGLVMGGEGAEEPERIVGKDPETDMDILVKTGRFSPYVERAIPGEEEKKPKRVSIPKGMALGEIDLETALQLLTLPRIVGMHPEDGKPVHAGIGRFGPYVVHNRIYASLGKTPEQARDVLDIGLNRAVDLIANKKQRGFGSKALRVLGDHPEDGKPIQIMEGRFGPYVKHGSLNASLGQVATPESLTMDEALALLEKRAKTKKKPRVRTKTGAKAKAKKKSKAKSKAKAKAKAKTKTPPQEATEA